MKVKCNKCGYIGEESEFPKGRDFFQFPYIRKCPKDCGNMQSPGDASMRAMPDDKNRPFDKIHDPLSSWGKLIIPWFGKDQEGKRRWVAYFYPHGASHKIGIKRADKFGFHNCRIFGK